MSVFRRAIERVDACEAVARIGRVRAVRGLCAVARDLVAPVGALVRIEGGVRMIFGEVIGFDGDDAIVMPLETCEGIAQGAPVVLEERQGSIGVGDGQLGRVVDALGRAIDGGVAIRGLERRAINAQPAGPMERRLIREVLPSGVRCVDCMTPIGRGQRIGIFAGPGVGKSTLLAQLARGAASDVNVIALIGERGREVGEFVHETLGDEALARSVVVASTGDESPVMRVRAAKGACAIAEHFRDRGADVLLIMDSATRFAHAQRQIGLAAGEPPATRGYTPSVFSELSRLLERAGAIGGGSITGMYTILVEGDDMTEPVADAARGVLDGHLVLSRRLAQRGHYPAIDVLDSVSRVASQIVGKEHLQARQVLISLLARYREVEELVRIGAYAKGSDAHADVAIELMASIEGLLTQGMEETCEMEQSVSAMRDIASRAGQMLAQVRGAA